MFKALLLTSLLLVPQFPQRGSDVRHRYEQAMRVERDLYQSKLRRLEEEYRRNKLLLDREYEMRTRQIRRDFNR